MLPSNKVHIKQMKIKTYLGLQIIQNEPKPLNNQKNSTSPTIAAKRPRNVSGFLEMASNFTKKCMERFLIF